MRNTLTLAMTILAAAFLPPGSRLEGALPAAPPSHVVIVIEENHGYTEVIGSSAAPYLNSLAAGGALMTQSFAVAHPGEPNYLALFSGSTQGSPDESHARTFSSPNLGAALLAAGKTFTGYAEDMPPAGATGGDTGRSARGHDPWARFSNVPAASNQPFTVFPTGNFDNLPLVAIVVPSRDHAMHDGAIQAGDAWLETHLGPYVQWANANHGLLIVTWAEGEPGGNNQIETLLCGPMVQPGRYAQTVNHYNLLRTVEELCGLPPSGAAAQAAPIAGIWKGGPATSFPITASAGTGGSIAPAGAVQVAQGADQSFAITAGPGSTIACVAVDGAAMGPIQAYTFTNVQAPHTISATFSGVATYVITASAGAGGTITPSGAITVNQGGSQTFTLAPAPGYAIAGVTVDGVPKGALAAYTFSNLMADHTIAATFTPNPPATFTLTASAGPGGTISPAGAVTVPQGGSQTFTITAQAGYTIASVTVDGAAMGALPAYTFANVTANHTIAATFKQNPPSTYTITASAGPGGTISPAGAVTVPQGGSQTFTITPQAGYTIAAVTVDGEAMGAIGSCTFANVTGNHTIIATFTATTGGPYLITAKAGDGGTITPSGNLSVPQGGTATFTIKANHHHRIKVVTVDGVSVGRPGTYTFTDVQAPHTITARFSRRDD